MLSKFVKDLTKVNKWLARQTLDMVNEGQSLQLPFELPELPALPKIKKRQDHKVMKYMNAPDLSSRDSEQQKFTKQKMPIFNICNDGDLHKYAKFTCIYLLGWTFAST